MGQCVSTQNTEAWRNHNEAEQQLKKAKRQLEKEAKILLLGPGDSGKTTIMKQMRLITHAHFSLGELESYRQLVFTNLVSGMRAVVEALPDVHLSIEEDEELMKIYQLVETAPDVKDGEPFPDYLPHFRFLWQHPIIREGLNRSRQFAIPDNVSYFYSALDRLFQPGYRPTNQDIIQTRSRTVGIVETVFTISDGFTGGKQGIPDPNSCPVPRESVVQASHKSRKLQSTKSSSDESSAETNEERGALKDLFRVDSAGAKNLRIVDVGGQKSERRKWIHSFSDVTAILFLVALSGYDQCLVEERNANQMSDAMTVWESICAMEWFQGTSLILFLNKEDLFDAKIKHSAIRRFFPDFDGEAKDAEAGKDYFKRRFLRIAHKGSSQYRQQQRQNERQSGARPEENQHKTAVQPRAKRQIYVHYTTAVNTSLLHTVMGFVADTVLRAHLATAALL